MRSAFILRKNANVTECDLYKKFQDEMRLVESDDFVVGAYLYEAMAYVNGHLGVISVAYDIESCIKKANEFVYNCPIACFDKVLKIKTGETKPCDTFDVLIPTYVNTRHLPPNEALGVFYDIRDGQFRTMSLSDIIPLGEVLSVIHESRILGGNGKGRFIIKKSKL